MGPQLETDVLDRLAVREVEVGRPGEDGPVPGHFCDRRDSAPHGGEGDSHGDGLVRHLALERAGRFGVRIDPQPERARWHRLALKGELRRAVPDDPPIRGGERQPSAGQHRQEPYDGRDAEGSHACQ